MLALLRWFGPWLLNAVVGTAFQSAQIFAKFGIKLAFIVALVMAGLGGVSIVNVGQLIQPLIDGFPPIILYVMVNCLDANFALTLGILVGVGVFAWRRIEKAL
jgi:hypothetical protein